MIFNSQENKKEVFSTYSDAVYADDKETRQSSFGFCLQLFGGVVHYKATKQKTVITSLTEAELLALSSIAKEFIYQL